MNKILNTAVIDELLTITGEQDPDLLLDLISLFVEDAPGKLEDIRNGILRGDPEAVRAAAHGLKGTSGSLGLDQLLADCGALETAETDALLATDLSGLERHLREGVTELEKLRIQYS